MRQLLQWAENFGKIPISLQDVENIRPSFEEDLVVVSHLMWNYFNVNLVGAAKEIFDNVDFF